MVTQLKWTKNQFTGDWESSDKRWEISPAYEPSIRGGSVSRPTTWRAKDRTGHAETYSVRYLRDAKSWCAAMGNKKEN